MERPHRLTPFITGLVAGAFILASLERVFGREANLPAGAPHGSGVPHRRAAAAADAPRPSGALVRDVHHAASRIGHGDVRLRLPVVLMGVLVLEIWFDYRKDLVLTWKSSTGLKRQFYGALTLWADDISPEALRIDDKIGRFITIVGIPSAFLLHGYVGFIFGSVKANPWWSTPLMPVVFIFSAIVSGVAAVMLLYLGLCWLRRVPIDMPCLDTIAKYLFFAFVIDFSLEMLDLIHRIYEAGDSFGTLDFMVKTRLFVSHIVIQICLGTVLPILLLAATQVIRLSEIARRRIYAAAGVLTLVGIFAMRWNVVIGGQLFSKSLLGTRRTDGVRHARGAASGDRHHGSAVRDSGRPPAAAATLGRRSNWQGTRRSLEGTTGRYQTMRPSEAEPRWSEAQPR